MFVINILDMVYIIKYYGLKVYIYGNKVYIVKYLVLI